MQADAKPLILGVDDDPSTHLILDELLQDEYELVFASNGKACLEEIEKRVPAVILMDVNMPVMNGLEACRVVRDSASYGDVSVIFISELSTAEERLAGYEAGATDYVPKPFDRQELRAKVRVALNDTRLKESLRNSSEEAMQMALTAMSQAAEIGSVLRFIQSSFACPDYAALAALVFETLAAAGLTGTLMFRIPEEVRFFTNDGEERPLEYAVLESCTNQRIFEFGARAIFEGELASLLIRQMPSDPEKVGRLKDDLMVLVDSVDSRMRGIANELDLKRRHAQLSDIVASTGKRLNNINEMHRRQRKDHAQVLSNLSMGVEASFLHLGLTEMQEKTLVKMIGETESQTDALHDLGLELDRQFENIMIDL